MIWALSVALALLIVAVSLPYMREFARRPMGPGMRNKAPGQFATLSQGVTHYQWHGGGEGPVLVLVHGLSSPSWVFSGLVPGLTLLGYRVLTYDLFGRGFSDRPGGAQDRGFFLRQLSDLLADQNVGPGFALMGYSMGGSIATAFAARDPDRVERLILLAPAGLAYAPSPLLANCAKRGRVGDWLWGLLGAWQLKKGARADARLPTVLPNLPKRIRQECARRGYLAAILSSERHMLSERQKADHKAIFQATLPVLAIWAEKDAVIPLSAVGLLAKWNRDAHIHVVPDGRHSLAYTRPKEVLTAIHDHLRDV